MNHDLPLIHDLIAALFRGLHRFPTLLLSRRELQILGGALLAEGPYLVDLVATALERNPALFTHLPNVAAELRRRQRRATSLSALLHALDDVRARIAHTHIYEQAFANTLAREVLACTEELERHPRLRDPDHALRRIALMPALALLSDRLLRQRGRLPPLRRRGVPAPMLLNKSGKIEALLHLICTERVPTAIRAAQQHNQKEGPTPKQP